ncbi:MAG: hypothetical protein K0U41_06535 [Gammaproteobacteria bacterium]|nr:hypothetical protein [Gammaproteobacteria bacterium]
MAPKKTTTKPKATKPKAKPATKPKAPVATKATPVTIEIPSGLFTTVRWIWMPFKVIFKVIFWPIKKTIERHCKRVIAEMQAEMDKVNNESK